MELITQPWTNLEFGIQKTSWFTDPPPQQKSIHGSPSITQNNGFHHIPFQLSHWHADVLAEKYS